MKKTYDPKDIEQTLYDFWEKSGFFKPNNNLNVKNFCIILPPPNITGNLHMGHAFQHTIMDVIIRYQRMKGQNTLWQVGTDHAGIATQIIVENQIYNNEGKTRFDLGRAEFVKKIWEWKIKSSKNITTQMRRLGNSVDWDQECFTMDDGPSQAVKKVFISLYNEKLIYRRKRLVNWDTKLKTAISDLEVNHCEIKGQMYYIRYPLLNNVTTLEGNNYLVIATTRPETLLGDTAIVVNPEDIRYKNLINQYIKVPIINRIIPIIGDKQSDINKGSGCVKITPAHDFDDYQVALRHKLPMINIFDFQGNILEFSQVYDIYGNNCNTYPNNIPKIFRKKERFHVRKMIINSLDELNLLENVKKHNIIIPIGDRSGSIIEPMLTDQWYVNMKSMSKLAIEAVQKRDIEFIPKQYENMYFSWMNNIQDWCISRQLWWGHRIPAWYDQKGKIYVGINEQKIRIENNISNEEILIQDQDVLDTWFSSSLWTFTSLGWPLNTELFKRFHPTDVLISGFDIIFFWIARMIMLTMHFIKDQNNKPQIPFKKIYITGLIRDEEGNKMSKSKGNVLDPLDIIDGISLEKLLDKRTNNMMQPKFAAKIREMTKKQFPNGIRSYGADALRFTLIALANNGRDINWDMNRLNGYRNFCNKLWNASRFVILHTENKDFGQYESNMSFSIVDKWIVSEFNNTIKNYEIALNLYRFDNIANIIYDFIWNQFCDWYLEFTKSIFNYCTNINQLRGTRYILLTILEKLLRLAHPIIPFITENIWQQIKIIKNINSKSIVLEPFPIYKLEDDDEIAQINIDWIKQVIGVIRNIRIQNNISFKTPLDVFIRFTSPKIKIHFNQNYKFLIFLGCLKNLTLIKNNANTPSNCIIKIIDFTEIFISIENTIDKANEMKRLNKEIDKTNLQLQTIKEKLKNKQFLLNAPKNLISREHHRIDELEKFKIILTKQKNILQK